MLELERKSRQQYVPPCEVVVVQAALGNIDTAFEWLDRALAVRDVHLLGLHRDSNLDVLAGDPRFQEILTRCACAP